MFLHHLDTTVSTNLDARSGTPGDVYVAEYQTAGRGRLDHRWLAPRGVNLMFSAVFDVRDMPPETVATFPLVAGLAVAEALETACPRAGRFVLKWPNDVLAADGRKLVGILCERDGDRIIAGVGINVNQTAFDPEIAARATSLALLAGSPVDRDTVLNVVLKTLDARANEWKANGFAALLPALAVRDALKGKPVTVRQTDADDRPVTGICGGIAADGTLLVGATHVYAGEAHVVPAERIHFLGIGGVGMAGLAFLLKKRGYAVTGCDKYATPRTRWLEANGIPVAIGHAPEHLASTDTMIVTPAVPPDEPELRAARQRLAPQAIRTRGDVLAAMVNESDGIAVCGTHGKTTTATFTTKLLQLLGDDPSWCIGGETGTMPVAGVSSRTNRPLEETPFVVEADESDGTLANYRAQTLVITSMDYDHPEHFKTRESYRACFAQAEAQARDVIRAWELDADDWPELPRLVLGAHNVSNARAAIEVALRRGYTREQIAAVLPQALATLPDRRFQRIYPPAPQTSHPSQTSQAALSVYTDYAHHPAELACAVNMAKSLHPKRLRVLFQPHRYTRTASLKDQFPAAFAAADEVILIPVYAAFEEPVAGGDIADLYLAFRNFQLSQTGTVPKAPQTGTVPQDLQMGTVPKASPLWYLGLRLARSTEEAWRHVFLTREPGDLILLAGAGDIINLTPRILSDLTRMGTVPQAETTTTMGTVPQAGPINLQKPLDLSKFSFFRTGGMSYGGGPSVIVGMGSNTWFSDCATDIELIHAPTNGDSPQEANGDSPQKWIPNGDSPQDANGDSPREWIPAGIVGATLLRNPNLGSRLAFMAGIPGTVGGWVKMNAGAFGHSISECIAAVKVQLFDANGHLTDKTIEIPYEKCGFGYRTSKITGLIISVAFKPAGIEPIKTADPVAENDETPAFYLARRKVFPARTCGSVFKNPSPGNPAGTLLEEAGAKALRVGGAHVWEQHANVIVAEAGATSSDILALARLMAGLVRRKFGIVLEPEIRNLTISPP